MGVVDVAFNRKSTHLAASYMDSNIKVYDLTTCNTLTMQSNPQSSSAASWRTGNCSFWTKIS